MASQDDDAGNYDMHSVVDEFASENEDDLNDNQSLQLMDEDSSSSNSSNDTDEVRSTCFWCTVSRK